MANEQIPDNRVKVRRELQGWSQAELARRAGVSRTGVTAIEGRMLTPSVGTALALARVLECTVEDLFGADPGSQNVGWAWLPAALPCRYWEVEVAGLFWRFPAEDSVLTWRPHDGVAREESTPAPPGESAASTLVIAGCDPAAPLLAREFERQTRWRMIVLHRTSGESLELLERGQVHAAGVHWAESGDRRGNAGALRDRGLTMGLELLHVAEWQEGLAVRQDAQIRSVRQAAKAKQRWIGRTLGAGSRRRQDRVLGQRPSPRKTARDHRGVVEAIRNGWADVGVCPRLASEEGRLGFVAVCEVSYDLCYPAALASDPRHVALQSVVRSPSYRNLLADLPGYRPTRCGEVQRVPAGE